MEFSYQIQYQQNQSKQIKSQFEFRKGRLKQIPHAQTIGTMSQLKQLKQMKESKQQQAEQQLLAAVKIQQQQNQRQAASGQIMPGGQPKPGQQQQLNSKQAIDQMIQMQEIEDAESATKSIESIGQGMFGNQNNVQQNNLTKSPNAIQKDFKELEQNNFYQRQQQQQQQVYDVQNQTYTLSLFSGDPNKSQQDMTGNQLAHYYYPDTSSAEMSLADSPDNERLRQALLRKQQQEQYMMKQKQQIQQFPVPGANNAFKGNKQLLAENMNNSISSSYDAGLIDSSSLEQDNKDLSSLTKKIEHDIIQSFDHFEQSNKEKQDQSKQGAGSRVRDRLGIGGKRTSPPASAQQAALMEQQRLAMIEQGFKKQQQQNRAAGQQQLPQRSPGQNGRPIVSSNSFEKSPHTPSDARRVAQRGHVGKSTDSESNSINNSGIPTQSKKSKNKHTDSELKEQRAVKRIQLSDLNLDQLEKDLLQGQNDQSTNNNITDSNKTNKQSPMPQQQQQHQYQTLSDRIFKKDYRSSLASESSAERLQHFLNVQQRGNESGEKGPYDPSKSSITQSIYSFQKKALESKPKGQVYETITSSNHENEQIMRNRTGGAPQQILSNNQPKQQQEQQKQTYLDSLLDIHSKVLNSNNVFNNGGNLTTLSQSEQSAHFGRESAYLGNQQQKSQANKMQHLNVQEPKSIHNIIQGSILGNEPVGMTSMNDSSDPSDPLQYTKTFNDGSVSHILESNKHQKEKLIDPREDEEEIDPKESIVMQLSKSSDHPEQESNYEFPKRVKSSISYNPSMTSHGGMTSFPLKLGGKRNSREKSPDGMSDSVNNRSSSKLKDVKLTMMNSQTNSEGSSPGQLPNQSMLSGQMLRSATELDVDFEISNTMVSLNLLQQPKAKEANIPQKKVELPGFDQQKWDKLRKMQQEVNKRMALYELDDELASRSRSFTVDLTDEQASALHADKSLTTALQQHDKSLNQNNQPSPKFKSSQASERKDSKDYAGFIDLEKMWIEKQLVADPNSLLQSQRSNESAFDKLAAEAGASHLSSLKYISHMKSSTQNQASSRDGQADQLFNDNTFMNALKQSTGSVGSDSTRQFKPTDATFMNALKQSQGSVGSLESSNNAGALQLYDKYMKIANMEEVGLNPSNLSSLGGTDRNITATQSQYLATQSQNLASQASQNENLPAKKQEEENAGPKRKCDICERVIDSKSPQNDLASLESQRTLGSALGRSTLLCQWCQEDILNSNRLLQSHATASEQVLDSNKLSLDQKLQHMQSGIDSEYFKKSQAITRGDKALTRSEITDRKISSEVTTDIMTQKNVLRLETVEMAAKSEAQTSRDAPSATGDLVNEIKDKMDCLKSESGSSDFPEKVPKTMGEGGKKATQQQRAMTEQQLAINSNMSIPSNIQILSHQTIDPIAFNEQKQKELEQKENRCTDPLGQNLEYLGNLSKNLTQKAAENMKKFEKFQEDGGSVMANTERQESSLKAMSHLENTAQMSGLKSSLGKRGDSPLKESNLENTNKMSGLKTSYGSQWRKYQQTLTPAGQLATTSTLTEEKEANGLKESDYKSAYSAATASYYQNNERMTYQNSAYKQHLKSYLQSQLYLKNDRSPFSGSQGTSGAVLSTQYSHVFKERQTKRLFEQLQGLNKGIGTGSKVDSYQAMKMAHLEAAKKLQD